MRPTSTAHDATPSPAPTWSPTPRPAATTTRSTRTPRSPAASGLPDVIAHGMFTLALAARYVDEQLGEPAGSPSSARKFTKPVVVPEGGTEVAGRGHLARRPHRSRSASPAAARPCSATRWRSCVAELRRRLSDHTTLRLGGPARAWVRATTEDELVDAVRRADEAGEPVLVLGGGSNLVVADEGFAGTVVEVATPRRRGRRRGRRPDLRRGRRDGRRRRELGRVRGAPRSSGAGSASRRCPASRARSAPPRSRTSAPTARRSRRPSPGARLGPRAPRRPHLRRRRLRLRLPHQPLQGRPGAPRRPRASPSSSARASSGRRCAYAELARTLDVEPGARAPMADVRRAVLGLRARQGDGARPGRPRHLERRLVLHQPRASTPIAVPDGRPGLAAARRLGEDQRRLADRAGRLRQGLRRRAGPRSRPSTRWR